MQQALVIGVVTGGVYGLYALGLVLVYRGSGVLNFAQAELGTLALFVAHVVIVEWHQPYLVGALAALGVGLLLGAGFERAVVWPLRAAPRVQVAVATMALLSFLVALELKLFGSAPRLLDAPIRGTGLRVFEVRVQPMQLVALATVLVVGAALATFLRRTDFGLAVQAAAQDQEAVRFLGISLARVSLFTWGVAAALSVLAALLIQPTIGVISASAFGVIFVKAVGAALIGGLSSMPGAFAGGITLGIVEAEIKHFTVRSDLTGLPELVIFAAVVLTLVFRPNGLFATRGAA